MPIGANGPCVLWKNYSSKPRATLLLAYHLEKIFNYLNGSWLGPSPVEFNWGLSACAYGQMASYLGINYDRPMGQTNLM